MRTFIAIEVPEEFRAQVAGLARCLEATAKGRFMSPRSYHMTLAFLGDTSERDVQLAMSALDEACAHAGRIPLECDGLGKFGKAHDATLWLGLRADEALTSLVDDVRAGLAKRGVAFDDKPFKPHITLARRASIPKKALPDLPFPEASQAAAVTLFKSELSAEGASYFPLYSIELD